MKWLYGIQQKSKTALLLLAIVVTIMGSNFLEKKYFTDINQSVSSIYNDRLIPAAELFHANDIMYKKRLALEKYLVNPASQDFKLIKKQLAAHNSQIDSIILAYEATYLVDEESTSLDHFKASVRQYNKLETEYLANKESLAADTYEKKMGPLFLAIHKDLVQLSSIQTSVGKELMNGSRHISSGAYLVSNLQTAIVVVIMLVVYGLLLTSRSLIPKKFQKFHLN
ncbi:MAG: MCP four helix bundle domain-containing protein [Adhaeribacter sp.]